MFLKMKFAKVDQGDTVFLCIREQDLQRLLVLVYSFG